jgi:hypothetical protein
MESYNKRSVRTAHIISTFGVLVALVGWWFTRLHFFIDIGLIIVGTQSIYFNRDLAAESVARYNINPKFARVGYFFVGLIFVLGGILWLFSDSGSFS